MTDGTNTKSPTYPTHDGTDGAATNTLTAEACTAIKASGVTIYTVIFGVDDPVGRPARERHADMMQAAAFLFAALLDGETRAASHKA